MGTCPRCRHKITKGPNRVKRGGMWIHKRCISLAARRNKLTIGPVGKVGDHHESSKNK